MAPNWREDVDENTEFVQSLMGDAEKVIVELRAMRLYNANGASDALRDRIDGLSKLRLQRALMTALITLAAETVEA